MTKEIVTQKTAEQSNLIRLYGKTPIPALEDEIKRLQREIDEHNKEHARLTEHLKQVTYTPEQVAGIKEVCARIALGLEHFTLEEKRRTYELLELTGKLTVEDGYQVAYVECVINLDEKRLPLASIKGQSGSSSNSTEEGGELRCITSGLSRSAARAAR